ncbi:unnamed protein product [Merluccius merluccius]
MDTGDVHEDKTTQLTCPALLFSAGNAWPAYHSMDHIPLCLTTYPAQCPTPPAAPAADRHPSPPSCRPLSPPDSHRPRFQFATELGQTSLVAGLRDIF